MVKRKWLWGKRSSEKMGGETESSGSLSSQSEKCLEDQNALKESPGNTQSPEVMSKETNNEVNEKETIESLERLAQNLSDASVDEGSQDSLSQEERSNASADKSVNKMSESPVNDRSEDTLCKEIAPKIPMDKDIETEKVTKTSNDFREDTSSVKLLTEKLSAALLNVSLKDDLVKQHSKVAEEAVAGWEKAENEVATLKQQLDSAVQQKSGLEARANHLDEALKECVRQLRLARDEQQRKINQAVAEKTNELELAKTKLEDQISELQAIVETSRINSPDPDLQYKLEILERENSSLQIELQAQSEELEVITIERDLSTKAAEAASKQQLEGIKKMAKLEAECRKLKSLSRVSSATAASSYVDSLTDSLSDSGEQLTTSEADSRKMNGSVSLQGNPSRSESWASALIAELDQFKGEKVVDRSIHVSPIEINLMDDFLEMERLAALPDAGHQASEKLVSDTESKLRLELESVVGRTAELVDKIEKMELEKDELTMALVQTQSCLEKSQVHMIEAQIKLEQMEKELWGANEEEEFYKAKAISLEKEAQLMYSKILSLTEDVDRQHTLLVTKSARCVELENELEKKENELRVQQDAICSGELKMMEKVLGETRECLEKSQMKIGELEMELDMVNEEKVLAETRECLEKFQGQLKEAQMKIGELGKELVMVNEEKESLKSQLDRERALSVAKSAKCEELENELERKIEELEIQQDAICSGELKKEMELAECREFLERSQGKLTEAEMKFRELEKDLNVANEEKKYLNSQLDSVKKKVDAMSTQIDSLKEQLHKERALAAEVSTKCLELENDLQQKRRELEVQQRANSHNELKIKQEDLEVAAGKLAECQKTIASLGTQLKSLATLEDFLIDTASIPGFSPPSPLMARRSNEPWKLHSNHTYLAEKVYEPQEVKSPFISHNGRHSMESPASSSSSSSPSFFINPSSSEKNGNGFAKYFSLSRN